MRNRTSADAPDAWDEALEEHLCWLPRTDRHILPAICRKYFDDERRLPFPRAAIAHSEVTEVWLQRQLAQTAGKVSLSVRFEGFEPDCLGYVFNIEKSAAGFRVRDITGKQLLTVSTLQELVAMVLHVSGTRYDQDWQAEFQKLRNQITSG